jgi:hypothetical protein
MIRRLHQGLRILTEMLIAGKRRGVKMVRSVEVKAADSWMNADDVTREAAAS